MSEQPYTYADIVVGTKKFFKPKEGEQTVGSEVDTDAEYRKAAGLDGTDSKNIKKDTAGKKAESATAGDADPNAPKFVANGYSTNVEPTDEDYEAAELGAKTQAEVDAARLDHFGSARKRNILDDYVSKNYLWTFAALSNDECNFPHKTYRLRGPKPQHTVIKMGGFDSVYSRLGPMPARPMTDLEIKNGIPNTQYFIDNVEIKTVVAPNTKTRVTSAFNIEFEVTEPYSMGQFLQHLQLCAMNAGYSNYLECPYLLQLDVVGYSDMIQKEGESKFSELRLNKEGKRQLAVKLFNVEFEVTNGGSKYIVRATPFNETALTDQNQSLPTNISISGRTVQEILQTGVNSLASVVNTSLLSTAKEADDPHEPDEIIILFPTDMSQNVMKSQLADTDNTAVFGDFTKDRREYDIDEAVASAIGTDFMVNQSPGALKARGSNAEEILKKEYVYDRLGYSIKRNNLSEKIKKDFMTANFTNSIGSTAMFSQGSLAPGTSNFGISKFVYDEKAKVLHRNGTSINPTSRTVQFKQGTKIQRIIEELVLISDYGKKLLERGQLASDPKGLVEWFRIEVQTYVLDAPATEGKFNKFPKIFVYNVVPAMVHQSVFMMPNDPPPGYDYLRSQAVKHYDYIYTGKNTDVLSFDIKFETAFYTAIANDFMNRSANNSLSEKGRDTTDVKTSIKNTKGSTSKTNAKTAAMSSSVNSTQLGEQTQGAVQETPAVRVARAFQDALINSPADLIMADLTILGDLYFMTDSGGGNYFSAPTPYININSDGTMNYQNGQVDIIINFKTPIDIDTGTPTAKGLSDVNQFSGLYQVITVSNSFRGNTYTNDLTLVRRGNQFLNEKYDHAKEIRETLFNTRAEQQRRIDAAIASGDPLELANALADTNLNGIERGEEALRNEYLKKTKADFANFIMRQQEYEYRKASGTDVGGST